MTGRFLPVMLGVNAALAVALAGLWLGPQGTLRHTAWEKPAPQAVNLDDAANGVLVTNPALARPYPQVRERPLFASARRPAPASTQGDKPPVAPPIALDKVVLTGIVTGPHLTGVLAQVDGESRFLKQGDEVGEWSLDGVKGRDVSFHKGSEKRTLTLPYAHVPESGASVAAQQPEAASASAMARQPPSKRIPEASPYARPQRPSVQPPAPSDPSGAGSIHMPSFGGSVGSRRRPASAAR